jgi:V/A-type H+-transporting ATPase subunit I
VERADYDGPAPDEHGAAAGVGAGAESPAAPAAADGGTGDGDEEIVADGGSAMAGSAGEPPVVQQNPAPVKPFEALVEVINRPKYDEFDPSVVLFLTFPAFFGFMIGDLGYGILYVLIGYLLYDRASGATLQSLGGIAMWAGGFTALFGVLYGEFFGLHQLGEIVWDGHPPIHKGLQPHFLPYAQAWLVLSLVAGIFHLTIGYTFDFVERLEHGVGEALLESGSWVVMMTAAWTWVLSLNATDIKPAFLVGAESVFNGTPFALGFTGFPMLSLFALPSWIPKAGGFDITVYLVVFVIGWGMLVKAELIGAIEFLNVVVNVLSYTRIAAVLLAKAGMAFVVNLLFFGAYQHDGEFHFLIDHGPEWVVGEYGAEALMFPGMFHGGIAALIGGLLVLVVGHLLVLALGITSAGLQAVRLEYVEFFGKFYEGGGERYEPFGRERRFTARE